MRHRDAEERIVLVERGSSGFNWFVIGAALGAGLGLLFAPASGRDTRKKLERGLGGLKERAEEQLEELADGLQEGKEKIRSRIERWVDSDHEAESGEEGEEEEDAPHPPSAREELERRLSQARSRRRRAEPEEEEPVA